jgi:Uma2 family endonuclease
VTELPRLTVAEYQRLTAVGVLGPDDRVELIEGLVVEKPPRTAPHDGTVGVIHDLFHAVLPDGWEPRCRLSLELPDSQPEPDFAVVWGDGRKFMARHPTAADTGLVVEVADMVVLRDRRDRARTYARAGVPVYWIVNLVDRRVEVLTDPSGPTAVPAYATAAAYAAGADVPLALPGAPPGGAPRAVVRAAAALSRRAWPGRTSGRSPPA